MKLIIAIGAGILLGLLCARRDGGVTEVGPYYTVQPLPDGRTYHISGTGGSTTSLTSAYDPRNVTYTVEADVAPSSSGPFVYHGWSGN